MLDSISWKAALGTRPQVVHTGVSVHGQKETERYLMRNLWCLHFYQYEADLRLDNVWLPIRPGYVSIVPPGVQIEFRFRGPSTHVFTHFILPEEEADTDILAMNELTSDASRLQDAMLLAVRAYPESPLRAEIKVWDILWELAARAKPDQRMTERPHPALAQSRELIELRLGQSLNVAHLAHEVGISHNQLTRLFRKETGRTIIGYIHERRARRARHLLLNTTLPMKAVSAQIGIHDPHRFNKFIHRMLGSSPSKVRQR